MSSLPDRVATLPRSQRAGRGPATWLRRYETRLLLLPALALIGIFYVAPIVLNFMYAFTDWSTYHDSRAWVGLLNFQDLFEEGALVNSIWVTLKYALTVVVVENLVALALALALVDSTRINSFFRSIFFLPILIGPLATGYLFQGLLATDGTVNHVLAFLTGSDVDIAWLGSTTWTIFVIALVQVWKFFGIHMLVYIAALNTVPKELLEASKIEGAGFWTTLFRVRLPLIVPAFTFNVTLTLIGALATFDLVIALTNGGPGTATQVMNMVIFQKFGSGAFGYASAMTLVLFLLIALLAFPLIAMLRRREVQA